MFAHLWSSMIKQLTAVSANWMITDTTRTISVVSTNNIIISSAIDVGWTRTWRKFWKYQNQKLVTDGRYIATEDINFMTRWILPFCSSKSIDFYSKEFIFNLTTWSSMVTSPSLPHKLEKGEAQGMLLTCMVCWCHNIQCIQQCTTCAINNIWMDVIVHHPTSIHVCWLIID